jgi:hypothetical protein
VVLKDASGALQHMIFTSMALSYSASGWRSLGNSTTFFLRARTASAIKGG